jgi:hypothetical protein
MSARVLTFDPSEFVVLEEAIELDESIQRPDAVRFFTVEEQETDAYELLMPKGRTTQFQRDEVRDIVDRMRELYAAHILPLPDDYALREPDRGTNLPWVHPVYADVERRAYSVTRSWTPLFSDDMKRAPGYYSRLIAALPKPYQTTGGVQHDVSKPTESVNPAGEKPIRVLPVYTATTRVENEDSTVEIVPRPMPGSEDVVNQLGYFLEKRPMEIPNPLADHPFLASAAASFVESTAPLKDVLPSVDAVLTHGVPVTSDPYGVAGPYLKLYDIALTSIPWSSWKSRFPPAEVEQTIREKPEIPVPEAEGLAPSAKILEAYGTTYAPGLSVREWLMRQDDGGTFVVKALLSKTIQNGSVEMIPGVNLPIPDPPATTLEECSLLGLSFPDFLVRGVLRRLPQRDKGQETYRGKLICAPLEFVRQERAREGYLNRSPWSDATEDEIKRQQLTALRTYRRPPLEIPALAEQKTPGLPESAHRRDALAVLHDPRRHSRDKVRDLEAVVQDDILDANVYRDADGQFVLCEHTLAVLSGDLEKDRAFFYDVWSVRVEGWRVCKYCGERITSDDRVDQDEYDEQGFLLNKKEALETPPVFLGESVAAFATGLKAIVGIFATDDPCDATVFQLLSLLQVLPTAETASFFLSQGRLITAKLGKSTESTREARGMVGLAITALLLQAHVPLLEPRRSFWSKPLTFAGWPRDDGSPSDFGIVDILLMVLENTYRGFPMALSGPLKQVVRAVLTKSKQVRATVHTLLEKRLLPLKEIQDSLREARALVKRLPPSEPTVPFLPGRAPERTTTGYPVCPGGQSTLTGKQPPRIRQPPLLLHRAIQTSSAREPVPVPVSVRSQPVEIPKDTIRRRLALRGVVAKDSYRTNLLLAARFASLQRKPLELGTVDPTQTPAMLKSIATGFVNEASQGFGGDLNKDVTLFCLLADYDKAKSEARKIRATERITYVQRMANFTDMEREINMELAKRGMAPTIIALQERTELGQSVSLKHLVDIGVGLPQDTEEQGDIAQANAGAGVDNGNYGDYEAVPFREGRDPYDATILDDAERSI